MESLDQYRDTKEDLALIAKSYTAFGRPDRYVHGVAYAKAGDNETARLLALDVGSHEAAMKLWGMTGHTTKLEKQSDAFIRENKAAAIEYINGLRIAGYTEEARCNASMALSRMSQVGHWQSVATRSKIWAAVDAREGLEIAQEQPLPNTETVNTALWMPWYNAVLQLVNQGYTEEAQRVVDSAPQSQRNGIFHTLDEPLLIHELCKADKKNAFRAAEKLSPDLGEYVQWIFADRTDNTLSSIQDVHADEIYEDEHSIFGQASNKWYPVLAKMLAVRGRWREVHIITDHKPLSLKENSDIADTMIEAAHAPETLRVFRSLSTEEQLKISNELGMPYITDQKY